LSRSDSASEGEGSKNNNRLKQRKRKRLSSKDEEERRKKGSSKRKHGNQVKQSNISGIIVYTKQKIKEKNYYIADV
jgi:hypothetical protein